MELKDEQNDEVFVHNVQEEVLNNTIYVFTPKGDVIELPQGSTPIDFAYRVHSGVGDTMVGALVNGNIVSLDYQLKDNDIVKINTNKNSSGPSREWIDMAFTSQAKNKIRSFFNKIDKEEYLKKGTEMLQKEVKKRKIPFSEFYSNENIDKILTELKFGDMNELHINIGNGKVTPTIVINTLYGDNKTKTELVLDRVINNDSEINKKVPVKGDIIVENINNIKINVASCCKPIPGDDIVGYISKGHGINVHRTICPNIAELEERIIDVKWNDTIAKKYATNILITANLNNELLVKIINKTSNSDISIQSINTINSPGRFMFDINLLVDNKENLEKFVSDISSIPEVINVERIIK
jgi:GTP pyrophosphokinase